MFHTLHLEWSCKWVENVHHAQAPKMCWALRVSWPGVVCFLIKSGAGIRRFWQASGDACGGTYVTVGPHFVVNKCDFAAFASSQLRTKPRVMNVGTGTILNNDLELDTICIIKQAHSHPLHLRVSSSFIVFLLTPYLIRCCLFSFT